MLLPLELLKFTLGPGLLIPSDSFSACSNTTKKVTQALGHAPEFNSHAGHVDAGVVRILELVSEGYTLIKP